MAAEQMEMAGAGHRAGVPTNFRKGARPTWHQRRRHREILGLLARTGGAVLDYGCGYGDLTAAIARTRPVRGVDVDPARVAFAAAEYAPVVFEACRPDGLDFPDASFDAVVSSVVIPFVPDPAAYLRECRRVLRPGGHLILTCKNVEVVRNAFRRLLGRGPAPAKLWVRRRGEVRALLEAEGFEPVAESYFYDPPFTSWKNAGDVLVGSVEQMLSLVGAREASGYYTFLCRLAPGGPGA